MIALEARDRALAIRCIDLTTLQGDDTEDRVRRLCARAIEHKVAAVCVYHAMVPTAVAALVGSDIPVAAVSAGFPHGLSPFETRIAEIEASVAAGAREIDIVIRRGHALAGNWDALRAEIAAFRQACGDTRMKAILSVSELIEPALIARAARICLGAGADFLKTSTGMEKTPATLDQGATMLRAIGDWHRESGRRVGFKAAGGIATPAQTGDWIALVRTTLGEDWLEPALFRLGASRLLDALVQPADDASTT